MQAKNATWLMPRSLKKNKNNAKFKNFVCKTQYI